MQRAFDESFPEDGAVWWHRRPDVGDYFCVICMHGVVIYGVVLPTPRSEDETPDVDSRWTKTWSQAQPAGCLSYLHIDEMDLILSKQQFELAQALGWPAAQAAIYVVLRMQSMAAA